MSKAPNWDLSDLYQNINDKNIDQDLEYSKKATNAIEVKYKGKIKDLSGDELAKLIEEYENISLKLGRIGAYAYLNFATNMTDQSNSIFLQDSSEKINDIAKSMIFLENEISDLSDKKLKVALKSQRLQGYGAYIRDVRYGKKYRKSQEIEEILHEKSQTANSSWSRFFDEFLAGLEFVMDKKKYGANEIFNFLSSHDGKERKKSAQVIAKTLGDNIKIFAYITNTLAKDKAINDNIRKFEHPVKSRNIANLIEDDVVESLSNTVKDNYKDISHKYYSYKASLFGKKSLDYWDRNAPLPNQIKRIITWSQAKSIVLDSYRDFSPEMADIAELFFTKNWIDAKVTKGKDSGAFSHPVTTDTHPYILMNFQGKIRDVMTLAHELGHGIHQYLAREQGYFMSQTPLTFAETASIFGEQLTFENLLKTCKSDEEKQILLASKVEDMINTIIRQIAFFEFEKQVHLKRREGELTIEQLGNIWYKVQSDSLGKAIKLNDEYRNFWAYIPHFIHSPFYVYAYSFGNCLVNSLFETYINGHKDFEEKYINMLRSGGVFEHRELLKPFNLDATKDDFWQQGLNLVKKYLAELI